MKKSSSLTAIAVVAVATLALTVSTAHAQEKKPPVMTDKALASHKK